MIKTLLLILGKILLFGWSVLYFSAAGWGFMYVAATARGLLRPDLWLNFSYGMGCIFAIYCALVSLNVFKGRSLLISGVVMHFLAVLSIVSHSEYYDPTGLNDHLSFLGIFSALWCIHFAAQFPYQSNAENVNIPLK